MTEGILLVISAPSGCGKTTILKQLMENISGLEFSVSHTTRQPRVGEVNGVDYHFVSQQEFLALRDQQPSGFLEWAEVHGNFYGTARQEVDALLKAGKDVILDIDIQGAEQVRNNAEPVTVFINPPTLAELERRLRGRGTESEESLSIRLANAEKEMAAAKDYRYLIVNDELEQAVRDLQAIIAAERRRRNTAQVNRTVPRS
jgi:guanylate kinase